MREVFVVLAFFNLFACTNNLLFKADKEIKSGWNTDSTIVFPFHVADTIGVFCSALNIRHTISYPYQNLYVFIHTTTPFGQTTTDTVECVLANKMGKWNAKGMGDILDFTQIYKDSIVFKTKGNYKIKIEQAMRYGEHPSIQSLSEIASVGVCIKRKGN